MKKLLMIFLAVMMVLSLGACSSSNAGNSENATKVKMVNGEFRDLKFAYPETLENSDTDEEDNRWCYHYDNKNENAFSISWGNEYVYANEGAMVWTVKNEKFQLAKILGRGYENTYSLYLYEYGVESEEYLLSFNGFSEEEAEKILSTVEIKGEKISLEDRTILRNPDKILSEDELLEHLLKVGFLKLDGQVLEVKAPFSYGEIRPYLDFVESYEFSSGDEIAPGEYSVVFGTDKESETMIGYTNYSDETVHFGQSDELESDQLIVEFLENEYGSLSGFGIKIGDYAFYDAPMSWIIEEFGEGYFYDEYGNSERYSWRVAKRDFYVLLDVTAENGYAETVAWYYNQY